MSEAECTAAGAGRSARAHLPNIGSRESDQIDFKERWGDEALQNLASFANTRGGTVYIGVDDAGRLLGTDVSDRQQRLIADRVRATLRLAPDVRVESLHGVDILAVQVPASPQPVLLRGSYWVRSGTSSTKAPPEQWAGLVLSQMVRSWDAQPGGTLDDIDSAAVRRFLRAAGDYPNPRLPPDVPDDAPVEVVLTTLRLMTGGGSRGHRVTNGAVLLFGKDPQHPLPMARVRVAQFHSNDEIIEHPPSTGTIFDQIDAAVRAVDALNPARLVVAEEGTHRPGGGAARRREDRRLYPPLVVREAIVNAVVHRDYLAPGDVQVRILPDRLEVWNPGGLPQGLTVETLRRRPHPSVPRNPLIANVAHMARLFEGWGTGTTRMIELCRQAGLPEPEFAEVGGGFGVTVLGDPLTPERLEALGLNERQRQAVAYLRQHARITSAEYQRLTQAPRTTAVRDLSGLVDAGLADRRGSGRGAFYVLAGAMQER